MNAVTRWNNHQRWCWKWWNCRKILVEKMNIEKQRCRAMSIQMTKASKATFLECKDNWTLTVICQDRTYITNIRDWRRQFQGITRITKVCNNSHLSLLCLKGIRNVIETEKAHIKLKQSIIALKNSQFSSYLTFPKPYHLYGNKIMQNENEKTPIFKSCQWILLLKINNISRAIGTCNFSPWESHSNIKMHNFLNSMVEMKKFSLTKISKF